MAEAAGWRSRAREHLLHVSLCRCTGGPSARLKAVLTIFEAPQCSSLATQLALLSVPFYLCTYTPGNMVSALFALRRRTPLFDAPAFPRLRWTRREVREHTGMVYTVIARMEARHGLDRGVDKADLAQEGCVRGCEEEHADAVPKARGTVGSTCESAPHNLLHLSNGIAQSEALWIRGRGHRSCRRVRLCNSIHYMHRSGLLLCLYVPVYHVRATQGQDMLPMNPSCT